MNKKNPILDRYLIVKSECQNLDFEISFVGKQVGITKSQKNSECEIQAEKIKRIVSLRKARCERLYSDIQNLKSLRENTHKADEKCTISAEIDSIYREINALKEESDKEIAACRKSIENAKQIYLGRVDKLHELKAERKEKLFLKNELYQKLSEDKKRKDALDR